VSRILIDHLELQPRQAPGGIDHAGVAHRPERSVVERGHDHQRIAALDPCVELHGSDDRTPSLCGMVVSNTFPSKGPARCLDSADRTAREAQPPVCARREPAPCGLISVRSHFGAQGSAAALSVDWGLAGITGRRAPVRTVPAQEWSASPSRRTRRIRQLRQQHASSCSTPLSCSAAGPLAPYTIDSRRPPLPRIPLFAIRCRRRRAPPVRDA